jgi:wobble nucleotide-excising tRNase
MKQTLFITALFMASVSCQKDISPAETSISPEKTLTLKEKVANDPLLLESCKVSVQAGDLLNSNVAKYNLKVTDLQKIDVKTIPSDKELIKAFESIGFKDAEQYVALRKQMQSLTRELHRKYPELAKISLQEWNEITSEGFKTVYASMGRTFYEKPSN